jgi:hypothetical protein
MISVDTKNGRPKKNFLPFGAVVRFGIRDPGWMKIRDPG